MSTTRRTQLDKIYTFLEAGRAITHREAFRRFGVQNLRARIHELRELGLPIERTTVRANGRQVSKYTLS